jgi:predicted GNAT family acetyltransferase
MVPPTGMEAGAMAQPAAPEPKVIRNAEQHRYELWLGDRMAGFSQYRERADRTIFVHTVIDEAFEGRGLGTVLAEAALDDVVQRGRVIVPLCPFIARYLRKTGRYEANVRWPEGDQE